MRGIRERVSVLLGREEARGSIHEVGVSFLLLSSELERGRLSSQRVRSSVKRNLGLVSIRRSVIERVSALPHSIPQPFVPSSRLISSTSAAIRRS